MQDFEEIYKNYYSLVYAYIRKLCADENLAEEITQETFFKVLKSINSYRGDCKLSVWICQIAKNAYLTHLKKQNKFTNFPQEIVAEESFEQAILNKDTAMQIHQILHKLEEPYREVFYMRTFAELSFADIARVHSKTESWARVTYHRAKMKIKEELK